jgi:hypothetical protein
LVATGAQRAPVFMPLPSSRQRPGILYFWVQVPDSDLADLSHTFFGQKNSNSKKQLHLSSDIRSVMPDVTMQTEIH